MLNRDNNLLTNRNIPQQLFCGNPAIQLDYEHFMQAAINGLVDGISQLPINPGFEKHPYKGILENIDTSKYIVGTFPPISYLIDTLLVNGHPAEKLSQPTYPHQTISKPQIPFFHGNVSALWSVLLTHTELNELNDYLPIDRNGAKQYLIDKLNSLGIYYDDIIMSTQRKLASLGDPHNNLGYTIYDKNLKNICIDYELIIKIISNPELKVVCFTNGATFGVNGLQLFRQPNRAGLVRTNNSDAFSLFLRGCQMLGLEIEMQCLPHYPWTPLANHAQAQLSTKVIFELRLTKGSKCSDSQLENFTQKEITVITPYSPAAVRYMPTPPNHPVMANYQAINGIIPPLDILKDIYNKFRNGQHGLLYPYNV